MFDRTALQAAIAAHGAVVRVVIAAHDGSSPREVGAAMLVWATGQAGTIGGGALEWQAMARARALLAGAGHMPPTPSPRGEGEAFLAANPSQADRTDAPPFPRGEGLGMGLGGMWPITSRLDRQALGPHLGQCCGGAVTLLTEVYKTVPDGPIMARPVVHPTDGRPMPLTVKRMLARARGEGVMPAPVLVQGWFVEPMAQPQRHVWVWGAGHVGRAVVAVLAPLPGVAITWVDVDAARFPDVVPHGVQTITQGDVAGAVAQAPAMAEHLVMTFSHALDLELCHRLLGLGFGRLGLIGSATKWARFRSRLAALGHTPGQIARIDCPIGDPGLGKHPQAIAIGVAASLLGQSAMKGAAMKGAAMKGTVAHG